MSPLKPECASTGNGSFPRSMESSGGASACLPEKGMSMRGVGSLTLSLRTSQSDSARTFIKREIFRG